MVRPRVRIRFSKQGDLRLIGHRDLMRCLERLFRRAGLALGMSQGFHPKPRMTFPLALAVGIEGRRRSDGTRTDRNAPGRGIAARDCRRRPRRGCAFRVGGSPAAGQPQGPAPQRLLPGRRSRVASAPAWKSGSSGLLGRLLVADRSARSGRADRPPRRRSWRWRCGEDVLQMRLRADPGGSAGPRDVLAALGLADLEHEGVRSHPHRRGDRFMTAQSPRPPTICRSNACSSVLPNRKRDHETGNADQRRAAGRMPDRDR